MPSLSSDPTLTYPRPEPADRFPRWRLALWLRLHVQDQLGTLPMIVLAPALGFALGAAYGVSRLSTVTIDGKSAAGPQSLGDVLWSPLLGGFGGLVLLLVILAVLGLLFYFRHGDDTWRPRVSEDGGLVELVCRKKAPVSPQQLGAIELVIRRPSGTFESTSQFTERPGKPYGVIAAAILSFEEPGTYHLRWYATENRGGNVPHEVARMDWRVGPPGQRRKPLRRAADRQAASARSSWSGSA